MLLMLKIRKLGAVAAVAVLLLGCSETGMPVEGCAVADSAGIRIVTSYRPVYSENEWSIDKHPELVLGSPNGPEAAAFRHVRQALLLGDSIVVVVDARSSEIRLFNTSGTLIRTIGREGGGPGEFSDDPIIAAWADTIVAWDQWAARMTWFHWDGRFLRESDFRVHISKTGLSRTRGMDWWQIRRDATLLSIRPYWNTSHFGVDSLKLRPIVIRPNSTDPLSIGQYEAGQNVYIERPDGIKIGVPNPFAPASRVSLAPPPFLVAVSSPDHAEVTISDNSGRPVVLARLGIARAPRPTSLPASVLTDMEDWARRTGLGMPSMIDALGTFAPADSLPFVGTLLWSTAGDLWVSRKAFAGDTVDVLSSRGHWLASFAVPPDAGSIAHVGLSHVVTIAKGEYDVSQVKLYRLRSPEVLDNTAPRCNVAKP
jgi:hypothetical protein